METNERERAGIIGDNTTGQATGPNRQPQPPQSSPQPTTSKAGRKAKRGKTAREPHEGRDERSKQGNEAWRRAERHGETGHGGEPSPQRTKRKGKRRKADTDGEKQATAPME